MRNWAVGCARCWLRGGRQARARARGPSWEYTRGRPGGGVVGPLGQEEGEGHAGLATRLGPAGTGREGLRWAGSDGVKGKGFPFYDLEIIWEGIKGF